MKLKKGSAAAKAYMAKIRAKRKKVKKSAIAKPKRAAKKAVKAARKKAAKKVTSMHKDTKSHNVRINVMSGDDDKWYMNELEVRVQNYIDLQNNILSIRKWLAVNKQAVKKLKGPEKKWKKFNIDLQQNELIRLQANLKKFKALYKTL